MGGSPEPATPSGPPTVDALADPGRVGPQPPETPLDPRLDTTAWRVFGRRFPRRWSFYFRLVAGLLLLLSLGWWFTRDVTYVGNVKVSGLDAAAPAHREPLGVIADDFKGLANRLADGGFGWQAGGLPALRAGDALSASESATLVALATLEVKRGGQSLRAGEEASRLADYLVGRGWTAAPDSASPLAGMSKDEGPLRAVVVIEDRPEGRERLRVEVTVKPAE